MKNIKFLSFNSKKKTFEKVYLIGPKVTGTIGRTFLSGLIIILFFYTMPIIINFVNQEILVDEFKNKSRKIMVYKLSGQGAERENRQK